MVHLKTLVARFACCAFLAASAWAQPTITALQNNYSYGLPGTPNYGIAQGSIFVMYGSGMGPASLLQPQGFPLNRNLGNVSIKVTVNGTTTEAIPYYVSAGQSAAILPSATPVGDGTITVTYNGQTSAAAPIHVVQSDFGILSLNNSGAGIAAIYDAGYHFITQTNAANPGQTVTFWGTGLGPDPRDETNLLSGVQEVSAPLEFYIGGKLAHVSYHGRSQYPGLDQVNVEIPTGVAGCYVSAVAKTGNYVSNFTTIPVAANGRTCSDALQLSSSEVDTINGKQVINLGSLALGKTTTTTPPITIGGFTLPGSTTNSDSASASFFRYTPFDYTAYGGFTQPSLGSCIVNTYKSTNFPNPPAQQKLNAGTITLTLPDNSTKQLTETGNTGTYFYTGSDASGSPNPTFIPANGGTFKFTGSGGTDVGPFTATLNMATPLVWSNMSGISTVNRSQPLDITWTGGAAGTWVIITGTSFTTSEPPIATFFSCTEQQSAGHFTIPATVLSSLVPGATSSEAPIPTGSLSVYNYQLPVKFNATGLDIGSLSAFWASSTSVNFQ